MKGNFSVITFLSTIEGRMHGETKQVSRVYHLKKSSFY